MNEGRNIPAFIHVSDGKLHDVHALDRIDIEPGAYYAMDRAYLDLKRLYRFTPGSAFFVTRTKKNVLLQRRYSDPVDKSTGREFGPIDQSVILTSFESASASPAPLRRVSYRDPVTGKRLKVLTNNFTLLAPHHHADLQAALAGRTLLQVDQTAPAHQGLRQYQRECRHDPNLDRHHS